MFLCKKTTALFIFSLALLLLLFIIQTALPVGFSFFVLLVIAVPIAFFSLFLNQQELGQTVVAGLNEGGKR
jgi:hypothetical protein